MEPSDDKSELEKECDKRIKRLAILDQLDRLADEHFKTTNLFLAKGMETTDPKWIRRGDEMCKEYHIKKEQLERRYVELGGKLIGGM